MNKHSDGGPGGRVPRAQVRDRRRGRPRASSGRFVLGPEGEALEREIAAFLGANHAVGVNSGTDALHLPLVAAGIGPGDEVVIPGFTFFATGEAVSYTGATPVFADGRGHVQSRSRFAFQEDHEENEGRHRGPSFRAVLRSTRFHEFARRRNLSWSKTARSASAPTTTAGEPAAGETSAGSRSIPPRTRRRRRRRHDQRRTRSAKILRMLRHHGSRQTYLHERVGWNSRLDELQAAVLRVKLKHLARFNDARRAVARRYREKLAGGKMVLPVEHGRGTHVYHQFTIRSERRDAIREALAKEGIASSVFYPCRCTSSPRTRALRRMFLCLWRRRSQERCSRFRSTRCSTRRRSTASRPACEPRREARVHQDAGRGERFCRPGLHKGAVLAEPRTTAARRRPAFRRRLRPGAGGRAAARPGGGLPLPHLQRRRRRGRAVRQRRALLRQVRARARPHRKREIRVETLGGTIQPRLEPDGEVSVDMGRPSRRRSSG